MEDILKKRIMLNEERVEVEIYYRLNFDADRNCGYIKVFDNSHQREEEKFEVYMEILECGLDSDAATKRFDTIVLDIKSGKMDVTY